MTRPAPGFLEGVRAVADRVGAVLIFDEVTSALRLNTGGIHLTYGVNPISRCWPKPWETGTRWRR